MNNEQKINRLKDLASVKPLVAKKPIEILDFTLMDSNDGNQSPYATTVTLVRINFDNDNYTIVSAAMLSEINENFYSFIKNPYYYHADIIEVISEFIATCDFKIEKEN